MLVFYLPLIILEAMIDVRKVERKPADSAAAKATG